MTGFEPVFPSEEAHEGLIEHEPFEDHVVEEIIAEEEIEGLADIDPTRTDGGHAVPAPFDRSIDFLITAGSTTSTILFHLADFGDTFNQAPFASLLPQNGGRDPETGKPFVQMDVILEVFGETLAGERVSGSARSPLTFCFHCNGCR